MTIRLTAEHQRLLDRAEEIVDGEVTIAPLPQEVSEAALRHLVESVENIEEKGDEYDSETIQDLCNTSVVTLDDWE
jgi:uncharacterized protein Yka (UPF0111/DUF47 family)